MMQPDLLHRKQISINLVLESVHVGSIYSGLGKKVPQLDNVRQEGSIELNRVARQCRDPRSRIHACSTTSAPRGFSGRRKTGMHGVVGIVDDLEEQTGRGNVTSMF